jgi:hypothetical protein
MFWSGHEIALLMLEDVLMRPFSPVFALLDRDRPVPSELVEFREETRRRLQARSPS